MADMVFCKDCRHHQVMIMDKDHCESKQEFVYDPVDGKAAVFQDCREKNKKMDCKEYGTTAGEIEIRQVKR